jgi:hypothetical protein
VGFQLELIPTISAHNITSAIILLCQQLFNDLRRLDADQPLVEALEFERESQRVES